MPPKLLLLLSIELTMAILNGQIQNGLALLRPPGHHAEADEACGFCLFNNVSVAAKYGLEMHR